MVLTLAPPVCRRKACTKTADARALCKQHYDELRGSQEKAKIRATTKEQGEIPPNGLGILRCAVCNGKLSEHSPGQSCRGETRGLV